MHVIVVLFIQVADLAVELDAYSKVEIAQISFVRFYCETPEDLFALFNGQ